MVAMELTHHESPSSQLAPYSYLQPPLRTGAREMAQGPSYRDRSPPVSALCCGGELRQPAWLWLRAGCGRAQLHHEVSPRVSPGQASRREV